VPNTAGQAADRLHFLRLMKLGFGALLRGMSRAMAEAPMTSPCALRKGETEMETLRWRPSFVTRTDSYARCFRRAQFSEESRDFIGTIVRRQD